MLEQSESCSIVSSYVYILRTLEKEETKGIVSTSRSVYEYRTALGIGLETVIDEQNEFIQKCQLVVLFGTSPIFYNIDDVDAYGLRLLKNISGEGIRRLKYDRPYPIDISLVIAREQLRTYVVGWRLMKGLPF